jgi:predicted Na+-dependent transporter
VEFLSKLAIFVFIVTSMFGMGLGLTISQIVEPFRSTRRLILALLANFVLVPFLAFLITREMHLAEPVTAAILLMGTGAGAPFLPKLAEFAKGNLGFAIGLTVLLMASSIIYMPIMLPLLMPSASVSPWLVAKPLLVVMLLPLALGLWIRRSWSSIASRMHPFFQRAYTGAMLMAIALVIAAYYPRINLANYVPAIVAGAALLLGSLIIGFVLGGSPADTRHVMTLGTAQRDMSAALLIAVENFRSPEVMLTILLLGILGTCVQIPVALALGKTRRQSIN